MKIIKSTLNIFIIIICLTTGLYCHAQQKDTKPETMTREELTKHIEAYITEEMSGRKITGLSVAIVDSAGILLSKGWGYADKENKVQADSATLFPVASITKTFTGIAVMQLVEQGLIDLDKPVGDYIEELSLPHGEEDKITTRMLLTHHSGIQGNILYNWYLPEVSKDPLIYEQITDLINQTGTIFPPGKLHSYSNSGYALLGVLIHRVSGLHYVDYIRSNILSPLGMDKSIVFAGEETDAFIARGYDGKNSTSMPMKLGIPAGGMALSAADAAKYMKAIIDSYQGKSQILQAGTMKEMMRQQNSHVPIDRRFSIGFTWFLRHPLSRYTKYAAHPGELPPYHAMLVVLPELQAGVLISTNSNKAADAPQNMAHTISEWLYNYSTGKTIHPQESSKTVSYNYELAKQHEGIYPNVYFGPMKVMAKKNRLICKSKAMPMPLHLIPCADSSYLPKVKLFGLIPLPIKQLKDLKIEFKEIDGEKFIYFIFQNSIVNPNIRIETYASPEEYRNYTGKYRVINMEHSERVVKKVRIKKSGDFYILNYTFLGRYQFNLALRPVDERNAKIAGLGYFVGENINWESSGEKVLMHWSGLILEKKK